MASLKTTVSLEDVPKLYQRSFGSQLELPAGVSLLSLVDSSDVLDMTYIKRQSREPAIYIKLSLEDDEGIKDFDIAESEGNKPPRSLTIEEIETQLLELVSRQGAVEVVHKKLYLAVDASAPRPIAASSYGFANLEEMVGSFSQLALYQDSACSGSAFIHKKQTLEITASRIKYLVQADKNVLHTPESIRRQYWEQFKEPLDYASIGHSSTDSLLSCISELGVEVQGDHTVVFLHPDEEVQKPTSKLEFVPTSDMTNMLIVSGYGLGTPLTGLMGNFSTQGNVLTIQHTGDTTCLLHCESVFDAWKVKQHFEGRKMHGSNMEFEFYRPHESPEDGTWSKVAAKSTKVIEVSKPKLKFESPRGWIPSVYDKGGYRASLQEGHQSDVGAHDVQLCLCQYTR